MDERLRANSEVLLTELGDGTGVLLHLGTKFYFTLNATCVTIWKMLDDRNGGTTRARIAAELSRRFQVDAQRAALDLEPTLAEMLAEGLITRAA